jgi:putative ABC transport system permease protein
MDVTQGVFPTLRLHPIVGRAFRAEDHDPDGPHTIMLGFGYWQSRFGGDPAAVGQILRVDGIDREIVGVMPAEVRLLGRDAGVIRPLRYRRSELFVGNIGFGSVARLAKGVTIEEAQADLARILPMAWEKFPGGPVVDFSDPADHRVEVLPFKEVIVGGVSRLLWILLGAVAIVLLIAAANVANLMLVHFDARQDDLAIRVALGAGRARILWDHLKETLPLAVVGGVLGLIFGQLGLKAVLGLGGATLPRADGVASSPTVVLLALVLSLCCGLLLGWIPSRHVGREDPAEMLRERGRSLMANRASRRTQSLLTVGQVALVFVLLVAGGLMLRSFQALARVSLGFASPDELLAVELYIPQQEIPSAAEVATTYEAIVRRLAEVPGVTAVGLATAIPMSGDGNVNPLYIEGSILDPAVNGNIRRHKWITGGFLEALEIPVVAGRSITWDDVHDRAPVALLSEGLARELFGTPQAAIGQRVAARPDPPVWKQVVGVVADVHEDGPSQDPPALVYWPHATLAFWQGDSADELLVWRAGGIAVRGREIESSAFLEAVRQAIWDVNPNLPVRSEPMRSLIQGWTDRASFCMVLLLLAGAVGILLAIVGVYGVVAYGVSRRSVELGLRMALGARFTQVQSMVLRQGMTLGMVGVGLGLAAAVVLSRLLTSLLFGVSPSDPVTHLGVAVALLVVVAIASYLPARRASRIDPMAALRSE